jgi:transcriptional regulator with XRE-family HTH domain
MDTLAANTGGKVRKLRKERGLYQHELAARARVSTQTVRNLEKGRHVPETATLAKIAGALGVPLADLFG